MSTAAATAAFRMPALGADMDEGTVAEWRVAPGDPVHRGQIVAVIDTEKSTIEVEVFADGVVTELLVPVGRTVPVGTALATIATGAASAPVPPPPPGAPARSSPLSSPLLRHLAERLHVDPRAVPGTGVGGRITRADLEHAAPPPPAPAPPAPVDRVVPPAPATPAAPRRRISPRARRLAAAARTDLGAVAGTGPGGAVVAADVPAARPVVTDRRASLALLMARSAREIPHYHLSATVDLGPAQDWLDRQNRRRPVADRLLPAALLLAATARAAHRVPVMNGHWRDGGFRPADDVDLGVAIRLRGGGLVAPRIRAAQGLGADELMARLRDLVSRARTGALRADDVADPSVTVTNLGDQGADAVFGIIYPPQVALVGFGAIAERPWVVDGAVVPRPLVTVTLSADHRASDGHDGARLLGLIDRHLQRPEEL